MRYLDYPSLTFLSSHLTNEPSPEVRVNVRVEAYSTKAIRKETKMFNRMEEAYLSGQEEMEEMSFSPEMKEAGLSSCFGRLDEKESRKVHFLLVSTLNAAYADHDFSSIRPDQFTREPSAGVVLDYINGHLLGPSTPAPAVLVSPPMNPVTAVIPPLSSSPVAGSSSPSISPIQGNADLYRTLNDVVPLEECEVYSWFPEPEYDPHIDIEDGVSDDGYPIEEEEMLDDTGADDDIPMDMDDLPAAWGAGMELDDAPVAQPMARAKSAGNTGHHSHGVSKRKSLDATPVAPVVVKMPDVSAVELEAARERRSAGLLWSELYFFYCRRTRRVLFLAMWCRRKSSHPTLSADQTAFPTPISSAQGLSTSADLPRRDFRLIRHPRANHNRNVARPGQRKSKPNLALNVKAGLVAGGNKDSVSSTIPIRGMGSHPQTHTPKTARLASSVPSSFSPLHMTSPSAGAFARINAGGFKPRQTPARQAMNAASAATGAEASLSRAADSKTKRVKAV